MKRHDLVTRVGTRKQAAAVAYALLRYRKRRLRIRVACVYAAKVFRYPRCCVVLQSIPKDVLVRARWLKLTEVLRPNRIRNAFPLDGYMVRPTPRDQFCSWDIQVDNYRAIAAGARGGPPTVA
jgi:hypothetical protein